ncbi:MAG: hypothetical protein ACWGOX_14600 [Desulforhopalus sp.]
MAIYNGRYRWDGTKKDNQDPIAWSPGAYDIEIFKCRSSSGTVQYLKSYLCIYARTGEGHSISANPEKFVKRICSDFSLDIDRVLWVEDHLAGDNRYEVVQFTRSGRVGRDIFYKISKREPLVHELRLIEQQRNGLRIQ